MTQDMLLSSTSQGEGQTRSMGRGESRGSSRGSSRSARFRESGLGAMGSFVSFEGRRVFQPDR